MHVRSRAAATAALTLAIGGLAVPVAVAEELPSVVINEVESNGDATDWIELINTGDAPVDVSGWAVKDDNDSRTLAIPANTSLAPGAFLAIDVDADATHGFGLGGADTARVFLADGTTLVDAHAWTSHATTSYGRCPDGTGEFVDTAASTPGAANACDGTGPLEPDDEPAELSTTLAINEVESNGDDTDWVEVANLTDAPIDISGWAIKDNDDTRTDVVPAGSVVPAGGLLVIDQQSATYPEGFTFGLGNGDEFRLYDLTGELAAKTTWPAHALVSWSRCADGVGEWIDAPFSTKGEPNSCAIPVRINEVESNGDTTDWVELVNLGAAEVDLGGLVIKDAEDDHAFTVPAGTMLASGAFVAFDALGYGLGGADSVRLFDADGVTLLDTYEWASHAGTTDGRCPDGVGDFETTQSSTKGAANACAGIVTALPWPGGADVSVLDAEPTFGGDLSGVDVANGELWAVQNGDGLLYRMAMSGEVTGQWTLTYPGGTGTVDAEGVHVAADGTVYVSSERNNDASSVSRPAVLRYELSGDSGTLVATAEWNLAADFPGLAANGGLEGVTWIPDAWLVDGGLLDASTGAAYDPATYLGHGGGLFVVGVEGTASAYAYALMADGSFARVASIPTDGVAFSLVADVQFDAERSQLWVVCDEACEGRIAAFALVDGAFEATAVYERPAGMANIANEGFAVGDASMCVGGAVPTFYADDADTDGFSLRSGSLPCVTETVEFDDLSGDEEHYEAILWMAARGISTGWSTPAGQEFRPYAHATRDAIAAFLYREAGSPAFEAPATPTFPDVTPATSEHYLAIEWAAAQGIVEGWSDGTFRPRSLVTRDAVAAFLYRAAGSPSGVDLGALDRFSDVTASSSEHAVAIAWLAERGITAGWADGTFRPRAAITRDAVAAFLQRWDALDR